MFAGGCVRDRILGLTPKDYDIATSAMPHQVSALFESQQFRVIPTGVEHGTVTIITKTGPVEITTLRRDVKTDGRHAVVDFKGATFATDAARRDFTMNSMFEDISGHIHDFYGGLDDIKLRCLKFVGQPDARIREDYLRILRYFRFWARLGFTADEESLAAIYRNTDGLKNLSAERITSELWAIFDAPHNVDPLVAMDHCGVLSQLIPDGRTLDHQCLLMLRATNQLEAAVRPWATLALLIGIGREAMWSESKIQAFARQRRFSEKDTQTLVMIFWGWESLPSLDRAIAAALDFIDLIEKKSKGTAVLEFFGPLWTFFATHFNDDPRQKNIGWILATEKTYGYRRVEPLPISGHDILEAYPSLDGKSVGDVLTHLRTAYRNGFWQKRSDGLALIPSLLASQPQKTDPDV